MLESLKNTKCAGCFESLQDKVLKNCFKLTAILNGHFLKLLYTRRLCRWFSCISVVLRCGLNMIHFGLLLLDNVRPVYYKMLHFL